MSEFMKALLGIEPRPSPGERIMAKLSDDVWPTAPVKAEAPLAPPPLVSEAAKTIARAIESSTGRWAFEDDQEHAHCYGLGITVSLGRSAVTVWHGSQDGHVRYDENILFEAAKATPDAYVVREALSKRRTRYKQELEDAARAAREAAIIARTKRAEGALERLARGECLEPPSYGGNMLGGRFVMMGSSNIIQRDY